LSLRIVVVAAAAAAVEVGAGEVVVIGLVGGS